MPGSVHQINPSEIRDLLANRGRNRWIHRDQISEAALSKGLVNERLKVLLTGGRRIKLLWLKDDTVHDVLRSTPEQWVGGRLKLR